MVLLGFWRSFTTGSHPSYRSCRKWWLAGHTQRSHGFWNGCLSLKNIWYHGFRWYFWWFLMCFWSISTSMLFTNATMLIIHYITLHYITLHYITLHIYIDHFQHPHGSSLRLKPLRGCWRHWGCVQKKNEHQIQPVKIQVCFLRPSAAACRGCMMVNGFPGTERSWAELSAAFFVMSTGVFQQSWGNSGNMLGTWEPYVNVLLRFHMFVKANIWLIRIVN